MGRLVVSDSVRFDNGFFLLFYEGLLLLIYVPSILGLKC